MAKNTKATATGASNVVLPPRNEQSAGPEFKLGTIDSDESTNSHEPQEVAHWFIAVFKKDWRWVTSVHMWRSSKLKVLNEPPRDLVVVQQ